MVADSKKYIPKKCGSTGSWSLRGIELTHVVSKLILKARIFGIGNTVKAISDLLHNTDYPAWYKKFQKVKRQDRIKILAQIEKFERRPVLGLVLTGEDNFNFVLETINSIRSQIYPEWRLFLSQEMLAKLPQLCKDSRICSVEFGSAAYGFCDYLATIKAGDIIEPQALYLVAGAGQDQDIKVIYSDEDEINSDGVISNPLFKVGWHAELASQRDLWGSLCFVSAQLFGEIPLEIEKQFSEIKNNIILKLSREQSLHLPFPIYHRRKIFKEQEVSDFDSCKAKQFAEPRDKISVVITTRDKKELIESCIQSIFDGSDFSNFEIIVVDNGSTQSDAVHYLKSLETNSKVKLIRDSGAFNYSRLNNLAAKAATGTVLLFLNNDTKLINRDSLSLMLQNLQGKIGIVGAKLLYSDNTVQHGGVVLGLGGIAGHIGRGLPENSLPIFNEPKIVSAVTGACLMIRGSLFKHLGGFDEVNLPVAFSDVDLCLRAQLQGYLIKYEPQAKFYHYESKSRANDYSYESRGRYLKECRYMQEKWGQLIVNDPCFSPNYSLSSKHLKLATPPRITKPWDNSSRFRVG
jgi:GT2 family glycosyltransferase